MRQLVHRQGHLGNAQSRHPGDPGALPREHPVQSENYAPIELAPAVARHLERVEYNGASDLQGRVHRIKNWEKWAMPQRIAFLRSFVEDTARDPAIARKAVAIIRESRVPLRDHRSEWSALLKWVQTNYRFTAEPNERIQSPQYTLTNLHGDCDDGAILLAALGHSIRLPFRFVLSGRSSQGERARWVEGVGAPPRGVSWSHIYVMAQWPPFRPTKAAWAEPTLDVPLGWDSLKEPLPRGRADMGEGEGVSRVRTILQKLQWQTVGASALGTVLGGVASYLLVQKVLRPLVEKRGDRRR